MTRRRVLLVAASALFLVLMSCRCVPRRPVEELACIPVPQPESNDIAMRWFDRGALVFVPAGEFPMGVEGGADNPKHQILLDDFWIHKTEVTNGMYGACVAAGGCTVPGPDASLPDFTDPLLVDHAVVGVTWSQADTYCKWIEGRLPTEAEWEKAALGTDGRPFPWGAELPDCDRINFQQCVRQLTHVLAYPDGASPYGGLDFSGDAFEWASDWYKATYYSESPTQNPPGPDTGELRVLRGGSFESNTDEVRPTTRFSDNPLAVRADLGFRCVVPGAASFSPPCEITSTIGRPYTPRRLVAGEEPACEPPPIDISPVPWCLKKQAFANVNPNGAEITFPEGSNCNLEGDIYACTGEQETSFDIQACTSCIPPAVEPIDEQPSCPPRYTLDETRCICRFTGSIENGCTTCPSPSTFSMLYVPVPEQQCCQEQAPSTNIGRALPRCDPGYVLYKDCNCIGRLPAEPEAVTECMTITVSFPHCGPRELPPGGCAEQGCQSPSSWDSSQCCCAIRGKCQ